MLESNKAPGPTDVGKERSTGAGAFVQHESMITHPLTPALSPRGEGAKGRHDESTRPSGRGVGEGVVPAIDCLLREPVLADA